MGRKGGIVTRSGRTLYAEQVACINWMGARGSQKTLSFKKFNLGSQEEYQSKFNLFVTFYDLKTTDQVTLPLFLC